MSQMHEKDYTTCTDLIHSSQILVEFYSVDAEYGIDIQMGSYGECVSTNVFYSLSWVKLTQLNLCGYSDDFNEVHLFNDVSC